VLLVKDKYLPWIELGEVEKQKTPRHNYNKGVVSRKRSMAAWPILSCSSRARHTFLPKTENAPRSALEKLLAKGTQFPRNEKGFVFLLVLDNHKPAGRTSTYTSSASVALPCCLLWRLPLAASETSEGVLLWWPHSFCPRLLFCVPALSHYTHRKYAVARSTTTSTTTTTSCSPITAPAAAHGVPLCPSPAENAALLFSVPHFPSSLPHTPPPQSVTPHHHV